MSRTAEMQGESCKGLLPPYLVPCIFGLLLTGCGFHLRQPAALPESLTRVQIQGIDRHGELAYELGDALADLNAEVVKADEPAGAVLQVTGESFARQISSVDSKGLVTQYELRYSLGGVLRDVGGAQLVPGQNVVVTKLLDINPNNVLGTSSEEELLQREMRHDAARQLLRQMRSAVARRATQDPPAVPAPEPPTAAPAPGPEERPAQSPGQNP